MAKKKKSGGSKRRMPAALAAFWRKKNKGGTVAKRRKRGGGGKGKAKRGRRRRGGFLGGMVGGRGLLGKTLSVARSGAAAVGGAVLSGLARRATAGLHKGNPLAEAGVAAATGVGLLTVGPAVARMLPIVETKDAVAAAVGAGADAVFVATSKARDAGKIKGVPGGRRGVLAGSDDANTGGADSAAALLY